jgi:1,4-dihydroxy-2-naphthoate octaprenyltransferase
MLSRSTLAHLRFPFSFFLLPIFLAALALSQTIEIPKTIAAFFIIHALLYPASNGFNSYFDRDTGPIGGLAHPPPVDRSLLRTSLLLDLIALLAGLFFLGPLFSLGLLLYGAASKLYSWDRTRLKARPIAGWLLTGFGQGGLTFLLVFVSVDSRGLDLISLHCLLNALAVTLLLLGIFPLTQIYQHDEDRARGDLTISRFVGLRGTFLISGAFLCSGLIGLGAFIEAQSSRIWTLAFIASTIPPGVYFLRWFGRARRDAGAANFGSAMRMNLFASGLLNSFYIAYLAIERFGRFRL